eukprot:scaffold24068_cov63-Phaeocystis_antarctica.AAC.2
MMSSQRSKFRSMRTAPLRTVGLAGVRSSGGGNTSDNGSKVRIIAVARTAFERAGGRRATDAGGAAAEASSRARRRYEGDSRDYLHTWAIRGGRQVNTRIRVFSRVFRAEVNTFGIRTYSGTRGGGSEQG